MRTITKTETIYTFDELSEKAKERALSDYNGISEFYSDEWIDTLNSFCNVVGIDLKGYSVSSWSYSHIDIGYNFDDDIAELTGIRLYKWIINNIMPAIEKRKYFSISISGKEKPLFNHPMVKWQKGIKGYYAMGYSRIQKTTELSLTGCYCDYSMLQPLLDYVKDPRHKLDYNLEYLINDCIESFKSDWVKDMEYMESMEYFQEMVNDFDWEFLEDGSRY